MRPLRNFDVFSAKRQKAENNTIEQGHRVSRFNGTMLFNLMGCHCFPIETLTVDFDMWTLPCPWEPRVPWETPDFGTWLSYCSPRWRKKVTQFRKGVDLVNARFHGQTCGVNSQCADPNRIVGWVVIYRVLSHDIPMTVWLEVGGPENPTGQLLPISRNKSCSGAGKEGKTKEVVEDREVKKNVCEELCVIKLCVC